MLNKRKFKICILLAKFCVYSLYIVMLIGGCGGGGDGNGDEPDMMDPTPTPVPTPSPTPVPTTGAIQGKVTSPTGNPLNAVHVRAVNLSDGTQLSAFSGIGSTGSNNKLSNLSGTNTKLIIQNGIFLIENVPAGNYRVLIEKMEILQ